jgi:hypothetical protein
MDLFNTEATTNLLPYEGVVNYYGKVLKQAQARYYLDKLLNTIEWKEDEVIIFGRHIITKKRRGMEMMVIYTLTPTQPNRH